MPPPTRRTALRAAAIAVVLAMAAGAVVVANRLDRLPGEEAPVATSRAATKPVELLPETTPAEAALVVSRRLFSTSQDVVLADGADQRAQDTAVAVATSLRVPVLIDDDDARAEIRRLGARRVLTVGAVAAGTQGEPPGARALPIDRGDAEQSVAAMDLAAADVGAVDTIVAFTSLADHPVAVANARSAGATVIEARDPDPRTAPDAAQAWAERPDSPVLAFGMPPDFAYTLDVVRHDIEQPTGGYLALPGKRYTALYGHPGAPTLGVLGEQGVPASVERVERLAAQYRLISDDEVVPTFEIIATVASGGPGPDQNYSNEVPISTLEPLVDAAEEAGVYVILDLQPGRTDFLTQAQRYRPLLERPHVGLALDPEWRLTSTQEHLRQIGSVSVDEVNRTSAWLATLTRERSLPQKLFVLHQFTSSMIRGRADLDTTHPELATVIHVDGSGSQSDKQGTWKALRRDAPAGLAGWGWKNFIDEDTPMLSEQQTWDLVNPHPALITYQ